MRAYAERPQLGSGPAKHRLSVEQKSEPDRQGNGVEYACAVARTAAGVFGGR